MSDDIEELDALAIALVKATIESVQLVHEAATRARPHAVRAMWRTPPPVVTWKDVRARYVAWMRELGDEAVKRDLAEGRRRGESTISPKTAQRLAMLQMNARAIDALLGASYVDDLLFEDGVPERLRLGDLMERSAALLLGLARMTFDSAYPALRAGRAIVLGRALLEYLQDVHLVLVRIEWTKEAEGVAGIDRATRPLFERLRAAEERLLEEVHERGVPPEPAPTGAASAGEKEPERALEPVAEISPEESLRQVGLLAAESRRVAAPVADIVVREIYPEGAPRTVSLVDLTNAIDARLGAETPRQTLESIAECDALVGPEDPEAPFSVHDLFEQIASAIEAAHERLAAADEETRREMAFPVLLRARLLALHLAGAAQMTGHPTVVAGLAAALGLHPAPGVEPVGSA